MILDPASRYFYSYRHVNSGVQRRFVEATAGPCSTSIFPPSFAMCTVPSGPTKSALLRQPLWLLPPLPGGPRPYLASIPLVWHKGRTLASALPPQGHWQSRSWNSITFLTRTLSIKCFANSWRGHIYKVQGPLGE